MMPTKRRLTAKEIDMIRTGVLDDETIEHLMRVLVKAKISDFDFHLLSSIVIRHSSRCRHNA